MAFNVKRIDPLDLQPRKAIGVSLPLSGRAVFNSTYQSKDAIKANIVNLMLTGTGERFLNPLLGTRLRTFLFENITESSLRQLRAEVTRILNLYFPRVIILDLNVTSEPDTNSIIFFLKYQVSETDIEDEVVINIEQ